MPARRFIGILFLFSACASQPLATTGGTPAHSLPENPPAVNADSSSIPPVSVAESSAAVNTPANPELAVDAPVPATETWEKTAPADSLPPEINSPYLPPSDLKRVVSAWIAANPRADFDEVARTANRTLREAGYPLVLDVAGLIPKEATRFRMKAGIRTFEFRAGRELSTDLDVCGERFLRVPGRYVSPAAGVLVNKFREYPFSLAGFRRERFRVLRKNREINVIYAPEPTEPIGIAANGSAVYLKFPLDDALTARWWQRMGNFQPAVLDEDPYLVIRVAKDSLYFDENLDHLPPQEFEVEQSDKGSFRWRFEPSGLTLELDSRCGNVRG